MLLSLFHREVPQRSVHSGRRMDLACLHMIGTWFCVTLVDINATVRTYWQVTKIKDMGSLNTSLIMNTAIRKLFTNMNFTFFRKRIYPYYKPCSTLITNVSWPERSLYKFLTWQSIPSNPAKQKRWNELLLFPSIQILSFQQGFPSHLFTLFPQVHVTVTIL